MKNLITLALVALIFSCQAPPPQRFFSESAEIDIIKALVKDYVEGNFDGYTDYYADTANIYHNSTEAMDANALVDGFQTELEVIATYGFEDVVYEMVLDATDETWVYFWGDWTGTLKANGQKIVTPVHADFQFVDGKIVREHAYFDNLPMVNALAEIAKAEEEAGEAEEEE